MNLLIGSSTQLPFIESRCRAGIYFSHRLGPTDTVAQVETDRMKSLGALTLFSDHCWSIGVTRAPHPLRTHPASRLVPERLLVWCVLVLGGRMEENPGGNSTALKTCPQAHNRRRLCALVTEGLRMVMLRCFGDRGFRRV